jgi:hypothetical protein
MSSLEAHSAKSATGNAVNQRIAKAEANLSKLAATKHTKANARRSPAKPDTPSSN